MKAIEKKMVAAVNGRKNWSESNTDVECVDGDVYVRLFGNLIYRIVHGIHEFNLCGWNTVTTRSRLNALGVGLYKKNFVPYYKGMEIPTNGWIEITE